MAGTDLGARFQSILLVSGDKCFHGFGLVVRSTFEELFAQSRFDEDALETFGVTVDGSAHGRRRRCIGMPKPSTCNDNR